MNLLITGAWRNSNVYFKKLKDNGFNVFFLQEEDGELPLKEDDVEAVVCNNLFSFHDIRRFKKLKYVQLTSSGTDRFPFEIAKEKNINVKTARGVYSIPISEHVILGLLSLYRDSSSFFRNKDARKWIKNRDALELYGKKIYIFGCGSVGKECAKKLSCFGCEITGIDLEEQDCWPFKNIIAIDHFDISSLENVDIVISTLPLNDKTHHFFNDIFFTSMKMNSVFVNVSRGKVVNENDLILALKEKLYGAVLDVFENEPLDEDSELWCLNNVYLTPHNSFIGSGNDYRLGELIFSNLEEFWL